MGTNMKVGVLASDQVAIGLVTDHKVVGRVHISDGLQAFSNADVATALRERIESACAVESIRLEDLEAIGVGVAGIIRDGVIEESPNLPQLKGLKLRESLETAGLRGVHVLNDADAVAAGIAATRGHLEKLIRVWSLGHGVGFGRYPQTEGTNEGGHMVVSLDLKEQYCGCGGRGHLEGIVGNRSMRLRFLDLEPEEVFANAATGDQRCITFVKLWHRALAAATATCVHLEGCGKFYISGMNAHHVDTEMLLRYLHEMVKMTPLQGSVFEVVSTSDEIAIIGAALNAQLAQ